MKKNNLIIEHLPNGITTLTLNRPEVHNALNEDLIKELLQALQAIEDNANIRVVLLAANGKNFSAGADLQWMQRMVHYSEKENFEDAKQLAELMYRLYHLQKPTIALAQGASFGGGIGLLACCDLVIAETKATFCFSEAKIGLIPAVISPYIIASIGIRAAQRYFLTAEKFSAEEAERLNLVTEIVDATELVKRGTTLAEQLLQYAPATLSATKALIHHVANHPIDDILMEETARRIAAIRVSKEGQERLAGFLKKNKP